jgi:hypothetical protein
MQNRRGRVAGLYLLAFDCWRLEAGASRRRSSRNYYFALEGTRWSAQWKSSLTVGLNTSPNSSSMLGFGLFAKRELGQTSAAIFAILRQELRPRPKPRRWANSLKCDFGS